MPSSPRRRWTQIRHAVGSMADSFSSSTRSRQTAPTEASRKLGSDMNSESSVTLFGDEDEKSTFGDEHSVRRLESCVDTDSVRSGSEVTSFSGVSQDAWDPRRGGTMLDNEAVGTKVYERVNGLEVQLGYIEGIVYKETKLEILLATTTDDALRRLLKEDQVSLDKPPFYVRAWVMRMPWDNEEPTNTTHELDQKIQDIGHIGTYGESVRKKAREMLRTGLLWSHVEKSRRRGLPRKHYDLEVQKLDIPRHRPLERARVPRAEEHPQCSLLSLGSARSAEEEEEEAEGEDGKAALLSMMSSPALARLPGGF